MPYVASIGTYLPCWGAPRHRVVGDDEERMLLALRRIVELDLPLPVQVGVNRGAQLARERLQLCVELREGEVGLHVGSGLPGDGGDLAPGLA